MRFTCVRFTLDVLCEISLAPSLTGSSDVYVQDGDEVFKVVLWRLAYRPERVEQKRGKLVLISSRRTFAPS